MEWVFADFPDFMIRAGQGWSAWGVATRPAQPKYLTAEFAKAAKRAMTWGSGLGAGREIIRSAQAR